MLLFMSKHRKDYLREAIVYYALDRWTLTVFVSQDYK